MIVHKCDRCKKEIENICLDNKMKAGIKIPTEYELCNDCMKKFNKFLDGKE